MSEAKVASDRQRLNMELTNSRRLMDSGALSPSDLKVEQDKMLMNERKLDAHAAADSAASHGLLVFRVRRSMVASLRSGNR